MIYKGNPWFQTFTGKKFDILNPQVDDICIEDIAHSLSLQCRFNGACKNFYSVGQHSVHVSQLLPKELGLWGLLHDAAEAYIGDVTMPVRMALTREDGYEKLMVIEEGIMVKVGQKFGLQWPKPKAVSDADMGMLVTEAEQFDIDLYCWQVRAEPVDMTVEPWDAPFAEKAFLLAFEMLGGKA